MPAVATSHTATGAFAFGGYYYKAFDWGYAINDPSPVRQLSARTCAACQSYITGLENIVSKHGYITGGRITINSQETVTGTFKVKADYTFLISLNEEAVIVHYPGKSPITAAAAVKNLQSLISVSWIEDRWQIMGVGEPS